MTEANVGLMAHAVSTFAGNEELLVPQGGRLQAQTRGHRLPTLLVGHLTEMRLLSSGGTSSMPGKTRVLSDRSRVAGIS